MFLFLYLPYPNANFPSCQETSSQVPEQDKTNFNPDFGNTVTVY